MHEFETIPAYAKGDAARRSTMWNLVKLLPDEGGATAIEYALIASLIAVAAIAAFQGLGNQLSTTFNDVATAISGSV